MLFEWHMGQKKSETLYVIHFRDPKDGNNSTLKARKVYDSPLGLSFVCISEFVFSNNTLVVKPSEEQMQKRLENVKSLHLSIYSIISIEEVGEENLGLSFKKDKSNILVLPKDNIPPPNN